MRDILNDYTKTLESLHFLSGKGSLGNKVKYSIYFMIAILFPVMGVAALITTAYLGVVLK